MQFLRQKFHVCTPVYHVPRNHYHTNLYLCCHNVLDGGYVIRDTLGVQKCNFCGKSFTFVLLT